MEFEIEENGRRSFRTHGSRHAAVAGRAMGHEKFKTELQPPDRGSQPARLGGGTVEVSRVDGREDLSPFRHFRPPGGPIGPCALARF
jgi:hypothetical protein